MSYTFHEYMSYREPRNALTKKEATMIGIPYPLENGWMYRHADLVIEDDTLVELQTRAALLCLVDGDVTQIKDVPTIDPRRNPSKKRKTNKSRYL